MEEFKGEKEKELSAKRVFIEIGTGELPVTRIGNRKFNDEEMYIGIDLNPAAVQRARSHTQTQGVTPEAKNLYFLQANAEKLPVKDKSASEVFLGNVLGDPSILDAEKDKFIEETKRILKKDGVIIIKETNTPAPIEYLKNLINKHNLVEERWFGSELPGWRQNIELYDWNAVAEKNKKFHKDSYLAVLKIKEGA